MTTIKESPLPNLIYRGKVRDTHDLGDGKLLMVATDRISAFDVVLPTAIPDKGAVLSQISAFWFDKTAHLVPNHFIASATSRGRPRHTRRTRKTGHGRYQGPSASTSNASWRGYITGSAWSEYKRSQTVSGMAMAPGLQEGDASQSPCSPRRPKPRRATTKT